MTTFSDLGLAPELLRALEADGYTVPTPIQAKAIPGVLAGRDLLGIAQTGTGKTAAFALPILQRLAADRRPAPRKGCRVLVLSPTRELATQIAESFKTYGRFMGVTVTTVFGGVGHRPQTQALARGVDILVATPGRLIDHMEERNVVLGSAEVFVLDEADQMLDLGFVKPIRRIVAALSHKRQNLFFSATMPSEIGQLAAELLRDPVRVAVAPTATTVERVDQRVILIESAKKRALLVELFADPAMERTLVFTRTKRGADKVARHLETAKLSAAAIHGNKSQRQREEALEAFKTGHVRILVATDIAARGIDVDAVSHVINFELPEVPESYVHRIGRTARAGAAGIAISLCDSDERGLLRDIERLTRQSIASSDRRGDAALAADKAGDRASREHDRRPSGGQRGANSNGGRNRQRPNGAGHAAAGHSGNRGEPGRRSEPERRSAAAPQRDERRGNGSGERRDASPGERRGNGQGERRGNGQGERRGNGQGERRGNGQGERREEVWDNRRPERQQRSASEPRPEPARQGQRPAGGERPAGRPAGGVGPRSGGRTDGNRTTKDSGRSRSAEPRHAGNR